MSTSSSSRYIPRHPTSGWLRSELERLGHSDMRGMKISDAAMCRILREHGYDVSAKPVPMDSDEYDARLAPPPPPKKRRGAFAECLQEMFE